MYQSPPHRKCFGYVTDFKVNADWLDFEMIRIKIWQLKQRRFDSFHLVIFLSILRFSCQSFVVEITPFQKDRKK